MVSSIFITDIRTKMHMNVLHESAYHIHCARMLTSDFLMTSGGTLQVLACNPNFFIFFICCIYIITVPTILSFGGIGSGLPGSGQYVYFWLPSWTSSGVTVSITLNSGYLICYASDRYQTPSSLPGYADWVVTINSEYTETFIDPSSLGRPRGSFLSFAFLGQQSVNNFTIQIDSGRVLTTGKHD